MRRTSSPGMSSSCSASSGIFGLFFDEEAGGTGTGTLLSLIAIEEVSKVCATSGLILAVQELGRSGSSSPAPRSSAQRGCRGSRRARCWPRTRSPRPAPARTRRRCARPPAATATGTCSTGRSGSSRTPAWRASTPCSRRPTPTRARGDLGLPRRAGHAGLRGRAAGGEDGDRRLDDGRAGVRRLPCPRGEPARRGGDGIQARDADPRPLAARSRGPGARDRAGRNRLRARVRRSPRDDGPADRAAPADRREARRHGDEDRGRPRAPLPLRPDGRRRRPRGRADEGLGEGEALCAATSRWR